MQLARSLQILHMHADMHADDDGIQFSLQITEPYYSFPSFLPCACGFHGWPARCTQEQEQRWPFRHAHACMRCLRLAPGASARTGSVNAGGTCRIGGSGGRAPWASDTPGSHRITVDPVPVGKPLGPRSRLLAFALLQIEFVQSSQCTASAVLHD